MNNMNQIEAAEEIKANIFSGNFQGESIFLIRGFENQSQDKKIVTFKLIEESSTTSTMIFVKKGYIEIIRFLLLENTIENFIKIVDLFEGLASVDYKKLRGDFAEAYIVSITKGSKITGEQKFDIEVKGEYLEVKSYSSSNNKITIKNSQIKESVKIIGTSLSMSNEGKTIIEMANEISNIDPKFSEELIFKYSNTKMSMFKFNIEGVNILKPNALIIENRKDIFDISIEYVAKEILGETFG